MDSMLRTEVTRLPILLNNHETINSMNTCKTCQRLDLDEINHKLLTKQPLRNIVGEHRIPLSSLHRHKKDCLTELFAEVREAKRAGLLADVDEIKREIRDLQADFPNSPIVRNNAISRRLDVLDREARLTGAYTQEAKNPADVLSIARELVQRLIAAGWTQDDAQEFANDRYQLTS